MYTEQIYNALFVQAVVLPLPFWEAFPTIQRYASSLFLSLSVHLGEEDVYGLFYVSFRPLFLGRSRNDRVGWKHTL